MWPHPSKGRRRTAERRPPERTARGTLGGQGGQIVRSGIRDQPDQDGEKPSLLKIQKLAGCDGVCLFLGEKGQEKNSRKLLSNWSKSALKTEVGNLNGAALAGTVCLLIPFAVDPHTPNHTPYRALRQHLLMQSQVPAPLRRLTGSLKTTLPRILCRLLPINFCQWEALAGNWKRLIEFLGFRPLPSVFKANKEEETEVERGSVTRSWSCRWEQESSGSDVLALGSHTKGCFFLGGKSGRKYYTLLPSSRGAGVG
ncbi:Zinc finger protein 714 [Plecturocebus cupreus]